MILADRLLGKQNTVTDFIRDIWYVTLATIFIVLFGALLVQVMKFVPSFAPKLHYYYISLNRFVTSLSLAKLPALFSQQTAILVLGSAICFSCLYNLLRIVGGKLMSFVFVAITWLYNVIVDIVAGIYYSFISALDSIGKSLFKRRHRKKIEEDDEDDEDDYDERYSRC